MALYNSIGLLDGCHFTVLSLATYFLLDQDYLFPLFSRSLKYEYVAYDNYLFLPFLYQMAQAGFDVLACCLLDYFILLLYTLFLCQHNRVYSVISLRDIHQLQPLKTHSLQYSKEIISLEVFSISIWHRLKIQSQVQNWGRNRKKGDTVKPRFKEVPRDWGNWLVISRIRYIEVLFHTLHYYWAEEYGS